MPHRDPPAAGEEATAAPAFPGSESLEARLGEAEGGGAGLRRDLDVAVGLARTVRDAGGRALVVGGYARDEALRRMGRPVRSKDVDVEVYGIPFDRLLALLNATWELDVVGAAFQVVKLRHTGVDVSIPRSDSRAGPGHRGFTVEGDPGLSLREASRRRDFTVNALALDPLTGELLDEHGGLDDLRAGILRATDPERFGDDSLRVLRAVQLAARFEMRVDPATADLCRRLDLTDLAAERVGEEWGKLLLRARRPSLGLALALDLGVVERLHPVLAALVGTPQDPEWHPEGDVWTHTLLVVDAAAAELRRHGPRPLRDRLAVMLAALCHDLGKPATTERRADGRLIAHGHGEASVEPALELLASLRVSLQVTARVTALVRHHLWPALTAGPSDRAIRRLARALAPATVEQLVLLATADHRGRGLPWDGFPRGVALLARAAELGVDQGVAPPLLRGRDLVALGVEPGPRVGRILERLYAAQEAGEFATVEAGLELARRSGWLDGGA